MSSSRDSLIRLLLERSVKRGEFVLASGRRSSYYVDARLTTMSAEGLDLIGRLGLAEMRRLGWQPSVVGGLTMGADPVSYAVALASLRNAPVVDAFTVRKEAKGHGTKRRIEGNFSPGASVVVTEDVVTSGGSALQAIRAVEEEGGSVLGVLAVVDREEGGRAAIEEAGYPVLALATASSLGLK